MMAARPTALLALLLAASLGACTSGPDERAQARDEPLVGGDRDALAAISSNERERLRLVAVDLVGTLAQLPELAPAGTTLQVKRAKTAFGTLVVRALEDAGYGLQRVTADQGRNHVGYSQRFARTDIGEIDDFALSVGRVTLARAYTTEDGRVLPSSPISIDGLETLPDALPDERPFLEQGGARSSYLSGVELAGNPEEGRVYSVDVGPDDGVSPAERTGASGVFARARERAHDTSVAAGAGVPPGRRRAGRTVLLFHGADATRLGFGNKLAVASLLERYLDGDSFLIRACHDRDGRDTPSRARAIRVRDELLAHGMPPTDVHIAPCVPAGYRRAAGHAPAPVELVHYRAGGEARTNDG